MESRAKTDGVKQLGELLQEEQEPFVLEVYLSETWGANRSKSWRSSSIGGRPTSRKGIVPLSKLLRNLRNKVSSFHEGRHRVKNRERGEETGVANPSTKQEAAEANRFSLSSDVTTYFSCSDCHKEEKPTSSENEHPSFDPICLHNNANKIKGVSDSVQWSMKKDKRQFNHAKQENYVAPLHDWQQDLQHPPARQEANAPTCKVVLPIKITEDYLFTASILEILFRCSKDKQGFTGTEASSQASDSNTSHNYLNSKMILQQTKQPLFDCVKIIETHEQKEKARRQNRVTLGPEEIRKLICDKITAWGRTYGDKTELRYSDYLDTVEEWEDCVPQKKQISREVGDAIVEEITNEIVLDMISSSVPKDVVTSNNS